MSRFNRFTLGSMFCYKTLWIPVGWYKNRLKYLNTLKQRQHQGPVWQEHEDCCETPPPGLCMAECQHVQSRLKSEVQVLVISGFRELHWLA